jgi:diguanylate cyclase (GGDEF)-like protein
VTSRWRLPSYLLLALGVLGAAAYMLVPGDGLRTVVYLGVAGLGTAMAVAGIWQGPRSRRRIWIALAVGQVFYFGGDLLWELYVYVLHIKPYPSFADASYLMKYAACALGLAWLVRGRRQGRDRAAFLDAAIITVGFAVIASVFLVIPAAWNGGETLLSQLVAGAYPVADVLILGMLIRLFTTRSSHSVAFVSLVAACAVLLADDVMYTVATVGGDAMARWTDLGYMASYLLMGFCAMHPSGDALTEPIPDRDESVTLGRFAMLALASVVAPVVLIAMAARGDDVNPYVIGLGAMIGSSLVLVRLVDLLRRSQAQAVQLSALARNDGLTGIPNRRTWDHELSRACAQARESLQPLTVGLIDLDRFKLYNDTHGHVMGDLVLKETTAAWKEMLGDRGFLARYGGEEFAVLVPASAQTASAMLDRMSRVVSGGQTCSIGLATWEPNEDPSDAVARADKALYHAKRSGRNRIAVSDGTHITTVQRDAKNTGSITAVFQPIVDIATGQPLGHEALSRFPGQTPVEVFAEARLLGTTAELEAAAIATALAAWRPQGWLSLNVSLSSLDEAPLHAVLPTDLTGLVFEISEAELGTCGPLTTDAIAGLRARGARIAVDDMGVGFSNLQRLLELAPDMIKIDMSIVRDLHLKPLNRAILRALVAYAREAGSEICAEGVETSEEWAALAAAGVGLGQGYLFGRPGPQSPAASERETKTSVRLPAAGRPAAR